MFLALCVLANSAPPVFAQNESKTHRKILVIVQPDYPSVLKNGHFEGQVRLEASVQANGTVSMVKILGGNPALAKYGAEAVWKWKYAPSSAPTVEEVVFNFNPK